MKKLIFIHLALLAVLLSGCSSSKSPKLTTNTLINIFAGYDIADEDKRKEIITKYNLDDEKQRHDYYTKIQSIMSDPTQFEDFLKKVDEVKKNYSASQALEGTK